MQPSYYISKKYIIHKCIGISGGNFVGELDEVTWQCVFCAPNLSKFEVLKWGGDRNG